MIELIGLEKSYGERRILSNASLTVRAGECIALVGANGSGKTTTLRCAVGLARATAGRILIDGVDMDARPQAARARVSYLAQCTEFPGTLTVREILSVVADLRGATSYDVEREITLCGLGGIAGRTAGRLSGGERQRVAIAALFIPTVTAYLLDEPTMNLDPGGVRMLVRRLAAATGEGRSVLFTTHVGADLDEIVTGVAVLRNGAIVPAPVEVEPFERHLSLTMEGRAEIWIDAAVRAGARRAWSAGGRLHAIVNDAALSACLQGLELAGARVSTCRIESALAAALERLDQEDHHDEAPRPHSVDRCVAVGRLWRGAAWARAGSAGPR
jgi:ABC-type multidrug transport system ATPase subunit